MSEYILTGQANSSSGYSESKFANTLQKRDWSIYVNTTQKAISAKALTGTKLQQWYNKYIDTDATGLSTEVFQKIYSDLTEYQTIIDIYSNYWLCLSSEGYLLFMKTSSRDTGISLFGCNGVRVLVSLSSDVLFTKTRTGTIELTGGNMDTYGGNQTFNCWEIH